MPLELPEQWLWDIIDEFIYQFQSFCVWRSKVKSKTDEEIALLAEGSQVRTFVPCASGRNLTIALIGVELLLGSERPLLLDSKVQDQRAPRCSSAG